MIHVDRILFPTDGSPCAERAHRHAVHLADQFDATLHVIHVEEREVELSDVVDIQEADILEDLHDAIRGEHSALAEPRLQERSVAYPSAAGGILTYATEHDASLVVLGTHGRRGVRRLVLGSVAEEVVRRAPCPVVTVGRGAVKPSAMEGGHMLVPVDFSEHQDRLLAHAREFALVYGMDLTLFHVVEVKQMPEPYGVGESTLDPGVLGDRAREALEEKAQALREHGVSVSIETRGGHPAEETLNMADELDAAFITIATHGRSGVERMLMGSVAEKVIRQAPCPVCTVKSFGTSLVDDDPSDE